MQDRLRFRCTIGAFIELGPVTLMKPVETRIIVLLQAAFSPQVLDVINESHMHSVPPDSETHFKVTLVSEAFNGLRQVPRHQAVYRVLQEELAGPVHALALHTFSPDEWHQSSSVPASPNCMGANSKTP